MIRIALTSIPPRFSGLDRVLGNLVEQGADAVVLTLPRSYARFPDWDGALPGLPRGVTLLRGEDRGAATKFITACRRFPHDRLVIADDDCLYRPGWLDALRGPGVCAGSTFDGHRIGANGATIVQGFAGLSFVPAGLHPALADVPDQMAMVDDIWMSAMIAAAGRSVSHVPTARAAVMPQDAPCALQDETARATLNRRAVAYVQSRFGIWR